ncbi:MAG: DUF2062 domain-containing protein [Rhizobiaceae bacterium]
MLWPRRSWVRSAKYVSKRILRLTATPHAIAAGVGAGVFASFTPFIGFHFIIAFAVAYVIAGNFLAAASGTFFGNPVTFPIIWTSTYKLGTFIISGETHSAQGDELEKLADADLMELGFGGIWQQVIGIWEPVFKPMLIGSVPLGVLFGMAAYILTRWGSVKFNEARKKRRQRKNSQFPID